jgi:anhydro-N-acetylmuramic acid kinase
MALYVGLISGTSADAIDAVVLEAARHEDNERFRVMHAMAVPYPAPLRAQLLAFVASPKTHSLEAVARLDVAVGREFGAAALRLLDSARVPASRIAAIGSHGQTILHEVAGDLPFSWQIGDPNVIAEITGLTTVADFRRRDIAAGGEGAPLMPAFHQAVLASRNEARIVLNIGGIANVTWLPVRGDTLGFDTGPGNCMMDAWAERHWKISYDRDGAYAAKGSVHKGLLARMLTEPYLARKAPKSTGRELFNLAWLDAHLAGVGAPISAEDVQATLCEFSVVTIARDVRDRPEARRVLVCGGGAHNKELLRRLSVQLPGVPIEPTSAQGIDGDYVEAAGFAWLAHRTLAGLPGNLPSVTGARHPVVLGSIHHGSSSVIKP